MHPRCTHKKLTLAYPEHLFTPQELLGFIESMEFTVKWDMFGYDVGDDLESLQRCIMAQPLGDEEIEGAGGLRRHRHAFRPYGISKDDITIYYGYFPDYGVVYLSFFDEQAESIDFNQEQKATLAAVLEEFERALAKQKVIR